MKDGIDHQAINAEILRRGMGSATGSEQIVYEIIEKKPSSLKTIASSLVSLGLVVGGSLYGLSVHDEAKKIDVAKLTIQPITISESAVPDLAASGVMSAASEVQSASSVMEVIAVAEPPQESLAKAPKQKKSQTVKELAKLKETIDLDENLPGQAGTPKKSTKSIFLAKPNSEAHSLKEQYTERESTPSTSKKVVHLKNSDIAAMVPSAIITISNGEQHQVKIGEEYKGYGAIVKIRPEEGVFETSTTIYQVKY